MAELGNSKEVRRCLSKTGEGGGGKSTVEGGGGNSGPLRPW